MESIERELPLIQRGIVDNCFEEGHYEYGIGVLDKLRVFRYKPFPLHIRQLLSIALYPPPNPLNSVNRANVVLPPSPQKMQLQRQKDDLWPKPVSRTSSIALLNAFVKTSSPESLMRALPYYSYAGNHCTSDVDPFQGEETTEDDVEDNSPLKNETLALKQQKDCWGLLRDGFVKRREADRCRDEVNTALHENETHVVGPYAWPVLEWLIQVFEKDERKTRERGKSLHSALLLCQIPSPRSKKGPRWDAETPLKVACACFLPDRYVPDQYHGKYTPSEKRFDLGTRLILLLVNLTLTKPPVLSPSHFMRALVVRLQELPLSSIVTIITTIPSSKAHFKVTLLESFIESVANRISARQMTSSTAPAPRAKPKFNGKGASRPEATAQDGDKDAYPMPTPKILLGLLASFLPSPPSTETSEPMSPTLPPQPSAPKISFAKFQLVSILYILHISGGLADKVSHWVMAVLDGTLRRSVQSGFTFCGKTPVELEGNKDIKRHLSQTLELVTLWETSCTEC